VRSGAVQGHVRHQRVRELHRGDVLESDRRELLRSVCELPRRVVLVRDGCQLFSGVRVMPGGDVRERDRIQRVCVMPGGLLFFRARIRFPRKLLVQRRVLRGRRRVRGLSAQDELLVGKFDMRMFPGPD
jgi:hypothetical protein